MAKTLLGPPVGRPTRTLIDPDAVTTKQSLLPKRKADKKKGERKTTKHIVTTPDGKKPLAEERKDRRQIVGIKAGELVRVRGDRDGKYVVLADPQFKTRTDNGMARGKVVTVELLGPGGPVTVPLRFCTPFFGNNVPVGDEQSAGEDTIIHKEESDE